MLPLRSPSFLALGVAIALLAGCEQRPSADPNIADSLTTPVARFDLPVAPKAPADDRTGEEVYNKGICHSCHNSGTAGAPKTGDAAAWAPRIATGFDALVQSVINGKGNMMPRAGSPDLTDTEIRRAVAWLANKAGANFIEPQ